MRPTGRAIALLFCAVLLLLNGAQSSWADDSEWYAGIEIGSKGIKVVALPIDKDGKPDLNRQIKKLPHKLVNNVVLGALEDGKFRADAIEEARAAIKDFYDQLTTTSDASRPKIDPKHIWIVASSGLLIEKPKNLDELEQAVKDATGGVKTLLLIAQHREVELMMRGAIPRDQWDNSMLVDIGNGNTKFGYLQPARPPQVEQVMVPNIKLKGTGTRRSEIEAILKNDANPRDFQRFSRVLNDGRKKMAEEVIREIDRKPGLINSKRTRVYISGGSPYAIAVLLYPREMARNDLLEVPLSISALEKFRSDFLDSKGKKTPTADLTNFTNAERQNAEASFRAIKDDFDDRNILIGAEILLSFNEILGWQNDKKELYFTKPGLIAWIVGFVVEQRLKEGTALQPSR